MIHQNIMEQTELLSRALNGKSLEDATVRQRYNALCASIIANAAPAWEETAKKKINQKRACYFSEEFLMGRAIYNNLFALGREIRIMHAGEEYRLRLTRNNRLILTK